LNDYFRFAGAKQSRAAQFYLSYTGNQRGTLLVAQLVDALRYKPEGRGFDSRWCHWNFLLT
jgi:hypothetical protein